MSKTKTIFIDGTSEKLFISINYTNKKNFKIIKKIDKSESLPIKVIGFLKLKKIDLDKSFKIIVNLGPGDLISIRNSVILVKILKILFGCEVVGTSFFKIYNLRKAKKQKILIKVRKHNILLDLMKNKSFKISDIHLKKYTNFAGKSNLLSSDVTNLLKNNVFLKKIVPITVSK